MIFDSIKVVKNPDRWSKQIKYKKECSDEHPLIKNAIDFCGISII
jgi:hypothetical protein